MYCYICDKEINYHKAVFPQLHIVKHHHITPKEYYDLYLRKENEGVCLMCGKETEFLGIGITKGYRKCCSSICSNNYIGKKIKTKKTLLEVYGDEKYVNVDLMKKTNIKKYGTECTLHTDNNNEKMKILRNAQRFDRLSEKLKKYNISVVNVENVQFYILKCNNCNNEFKIGKDLFYNRIINNYPVCLICYPLKRSSGIEEEFSKYIQELYFGEIIRNSRKIIVGKEIDIYIPELKLAFEFNGIYWHSILNKHKNYHKNKTEMCEKLGIHLIHIYEDDWANKQNIIKNEIKKLLKLFDNVEFSKDDIVKEVNNEEATIFLKENSLYENVCGNVNIGYFHCNQLVAIMIFNKLINNKYKLLRCCNKLVMKNYEIEKKMLDYFKNKYNPNNINVLVDRSWICNEINSLYNVLGFTFVSKTKPNRFYINTNDIREIDKNSIMNDPSKYIYDSGNLKYRYEVDLNKEIKNV
jgi:hypothetical protein